MAALVLNEVSDPRYCPFIRFAEGTLKTPLKLTLGPQLDRFEPHMIPSEAYFESGHKCVADIVPINGRISFCAEIRDIIQALEPDVHQFFPVKIVRRRSKKPIYRPDGRELNQPYFYFNVQCMLDPVCIDRSNVRLGPVRTGRPQSVGLNPGHYDRIVVYREKIAGHHIWRGQYQMPDNLFFSNALVEAIKSRKFRKLYFFYLAEV